MYSSRPNIQKLLRAEWRFQSSLFLVDIFLLRGSWYYPDNILYLYICTYAYTSVQLCINNNRHMTQRTWPPIRKTDAEPSLSEATTSKHTFSFSDRDSSFSFRRTSDTKSLKTASRSRIFSIPLKRSSLLYLPAKSLKDALEGRRRIESFGSRWMKKTPWHITV